MKPVERVGDRFALVREIGSGGMSTVYLGRDEVLDRSVAVKILRSDLEDPDLASRFEREGRTAAMLSHPNIVQVYDAGKDDEGDEEVSYIVMEYVSGGDLGGLIEREGSLSGRRISLLGSDIAAGLAHAHERGVIHRDIKPQNILIDGNGNPKLTDFGIARALDATAQATKTGFYLGTALYSAPEQLEGREVTPKSDIYALGMTLYHAATGAPPFSGSQIEVATQHTSREPIPPRQAGARITPRMEDVILSCISKDPDARPEAAELRTRLHDAGDYDSGAAAGEGIRRIDGRPAETVSLPTREVQTEGASRGLLIVAAAAVVVLLLALFGVWTLTNGGPDASSGGASTNDRSGPGETSGGVSSESSGNASGGAAGEGSVETGLVGGGQTTGPETTIEADEETSEETRPEESTQQEDEEDSGPLPPTEEAATSVYQTYVSAAYGNFAQSWGYLSSDYQDEVGSVADWESRQSSLDYISFSSMPQATLDGREARVNFTSEQTRNGVPQTVSGTWVCVSEDGRWKLDRLEGN